MERIEELEARLAWYEKQLADLDGVVRDLFGEVAELRRTVDGMAADRDPTTPSGGHEPPPHY